ncbi:MAG: DUF4198 domain-containing protein [Woeseiaceae bacterium]|nr:DUF4198 domain-containing protein [Woeseiaceae bacterium]
MTHSSKLAVWAVVPVLAFLAMQAGAHTLFFKPATFFVAQGQEVKIPLLNGTFVDSANRIMTSRMDDVTMIAPGGDEVDVDSSHWSYNDKISNLTVNFELAGNYVIGISTRPSIVRITADNFNFYLRYEGLDDDAQERNALGETDIGAAERYSKYSKAILQVGQDKSDNFGAVLGYPVEIVPLQNPYALGKGDVFRARILKDGQPLANELVYATHEGHYEISDEGIFEELVRVRSDENGEVEFVLAEEGRWYIRFIHLTRMGDEEHWYSGLLIFLGADEPRIPYKSLWATLTFEVGR